MSQTKISDITQQNNLFTNQLKVLKRTAPRSFHLNLIHKKSSLKTCLVQ